MKCKTRNTPGPNSSRSLLSNLCACELHISPRPLTGVCSLRKRHTVTSTHTKLAEEEEEEEDAHARAHANESTSESSATTTRGMEAMRSVSSSPSVCLSCHHSRTNKSNNKVKEWKEARRRREREYLCLSREMFFFSLCLSLSLFVRSSARNADR